MLIKYQGPFTAGDRYSPDSWHGSPLGVIEILAVGRFEALKAALLCYLHGRAAFGRYFPYLHAASTGTAEINPAAVSRPTWGNIFVCVIGETTGLAAIGGDYVDGGVSFEPGIENDLAAIRRPARRTG